MKDSKSTVTIKEISTKKEIRDFVNFPLKLYKDVPQFIPPFISDDIDDWDPKKNPAFSYCEAKRFLAYRDGKIVGRIGAILSHRANETWHTNRMRFSQVDFIDDYEVSKALFAAVENWAREKACEEIHGPLGFTDQDREGMLIEGYDEQSMFITYYNHPYYNEHLEKLGYAKDVDWIEYKIKVPELESKQGKVLFKMSDRLLKIHNLHIAEVKHRKEYVGYIKSVFDLANIAYKDLYGVVALSQEQIDRLAKKYIPIINPDCVCFLMDENDDMVGFGISAPSMAQALKKSNGRLFPFGWAGILKSLRKNDTLDLFLIAIKPELQGSGVSAIILSHFLKAAVKNGIKYAETGPQLETNSKILGQWKMFEKEQHKRRRCYIKSIN